MRHEAFTDVFTKEFMSFTARMWLDYCDETQSPFAVTKDYAGMWKRTLSGWSGNLTDAMVKRNSTLNEDK